VRAAQPGPARPRPAQLVRPTAWPSSARREHACATARARTTQCARRGTRAPRRRHHRRTGGGAGKGTAGPHRRVDGGAVRAHGIDSGRVRHGGAAKAMAPRLTSGGSDGDVRTVRRGRRRGTCDSVATGAEAAGVAGRRWWRGASDTCGRERTVARLRTAAVGGARGEAVGGSAWSGRGRLSGRTHKVPTAPLRHGTARVHGSHVEMAR
jgi:hypothetical protein